MNNTFYSTCWIDGRKLIRGKILFLQYYGDFTAAFGDLAEIGGLIVRAIGNAIDTVLGMLGIEFEGGILNAIKGVFTGIIKTIENLIRKALVTKVANKGMTMVIANELETYN